MSLLVVEKSFTYIFKRKTKTFDTKKQNIIIIGTISTNKGNQAMCFTAIDQIKQRFPNKKIYAFVNTDYDKDDLEEKNLNFKIIPWNLDRRNRKSCFWYRLLMGNIKYSYEEKEIKTILQNTMCILDVNGYRLTSVTEPDTWITCLLDIVIAKKYGIPYLLCPVSIGPLNFRLLERFYIYHLLKLYLKYPEKVYTRTNDGIRYFRQFRKDEASQAFDIVLQNHSYQISNLYKKKVIFKNYPIPPNAVGFIPNFRVNKRAGQNNIYLILNILIKALIDAKKKVYLIQHSREDLEIIIKLKEQFQSNENVILIADNLNVIELENIIKKFDFVVASRYHSIIHAYKYTVPALVIGWSYKYIGLLKSFKQIEFYFDIREGIEVNNVREKLEKMINNYKSEKIIISEILKAILKRDNWFDLIENNFKVKAKRIMEKNTQITKEQVKVT